MPRLTLLAAWALWYLERGDVRCAALLTGIMGSDASRSA